MKVQTINKEYNINTKGHFVKPGKYTNLAYFTLFAASLLSAADSFSKSPTKNEPAAPKTEVVTAGLHSDSEFEEQLLNIL